MIDIINPTEDQEQATVVDWANRTSGIDPRRGLLLHVPNGGARSPATGARMRRLGVRPGVPDLLLPVAVLPYHALWIEMKRRRGGSLSPEQRAWIGALRYEGCAVVVARGADEAIEAIEMYLAGRLVCLQ